VAVTGVWQLKGVRRNTDNGRCSEEDVKAHVIGFSGLEEMETETIK
jgi:hypothetical protein